MVTGFINGQPITLDNAATETTLKQLLTSLQTLNQSVVNMGNNGGGGGGGTSAALAGIASSGGIVSGLFRGLAGILGSVVGGLMGLVGAFAPAIGNLANFAGNLIQGTGSLSGFYGALSALPGPLGMVASLFQKIAELQEKEYDTYKQLTQAGVNFGGSLTDIRQSALGLGLTLDQFAGFVRNNSAALQMMGDATNDGAEAFVRLGRDIRNSNVGAELRGLGFSFEQVNQGIANYIAMSGGRTAEEMKNTKGLTAGASEYLKQLDMLSQITGQSREELEKQQKEQSKNAAYQSYLQTLDEKGREKAMAAMNAALAKGGKGAADALQSKLLGLPPLTQEAQIFTSMAGQSADALDDMVNGVKDSSKTMKDIDNATGKLTVGLAQRGKELGTQLGGALIAQGGTIGQFASLSISAANELARNNIKNQSDYEKYIAEIRKEQQARENSTAAQAAESANAFKNMGDTIYGMLAPALNTITPIINSLATEFMSFTTSNGVMEKVKDSLTTLAVYVSNFAKNLMSEEGRAKIINDLKYYFSLLMIEIKKAIIPWFTNSRAEEEIAELGREKVKADKKSGVIAYDTGLKEKLNAVQVPLTTISAAPNTPSNIASAEKNEIEKKKSEIYGSAPATTVEKTKTTPTTVVAESKTLTTEMQQLNKQTAELVIIMKESLDNIKRNVDATRSLNRNLFPT